MRGRFSFYTIRKQICSHCGAIGPQDVVGHRHALQQDYALFSRPVRNIVIMAPYASLTLIND